ncbi:hypothetical protein GGS23DRAFT_496190 [Durotheca rogersii]|uniref:uncharacterized protein n=1 Tax=Durotheca rogersii TaxID=419775 RepID=UPI0022208C1D|nr:uncharacterized protein GGS23DRAFT_496190 [Durotheca rogersii]KAI5864358.1 hypothetical protein GGS23DRAFT_496190 [Durotheca rogersii]
MMYVLWMTGNTNRRTVPVLILILPIIMNTIPPFLAAYYLLALRSYYTPLEREVTITTLELRLYFHCQSFVEPRLVPGTEGSSRHSGQNPIPRPRMGTWRRYPSDDGR